MYHVRGDIGVESYLVKSYNELCSYEDEEFIIRAYWAILNRYPDPDGSRYYLSRLQAGYSKVHVLAQISRSSENAQQTATLPNLGVRLRRHRSASLFGLAWLCRLFGYAEGNSRSERRDRALLRALLGIRTQVGQLGNELHLAGPVHQAVAETPLPQVAETDISGHASDAHTPDTRQAKETLNLGNREFALPLSMDSRTRQLIEALEREILFTKKAV